MPVEEHTLAETREYLDGIPRAGPPSSTLAGMIERMRNDLIARGGGRYRVHDKEGRVTLCEDVLPDGAIRPVPEDEWYYFLDDED